MSDRPVLNGSDYLMLGFDHELRRLGYAGNSCQIILELGCAICREKLEKRLSELCRLWPIVHARPGGLMLPRWKVRLGPRSPEPVSIRVHQESPGIEHAIVNEPLAMDKGELLRFDLIQCAGGRSKAVFSWAHALMDAPSAEYLLASIGR